MQRNNDRMSASGCSTWRVIRLRITRFSCRQVAMHRSRPRHAVGSDMPQEVVVQRFWCTLILYDLIHERRPHAVARKFSLTPGQVEQYAFNGCQSRARLN